MAWSQQEISRYLPDSFPDVSPVLEPHYQLITCNFQLTSDESNLHQFSLETLTPDQFVHIDSAAAKALGLVSGPGSLLSHLDRCRTAPGKRLLAQWVKQPLSNVGRINDRLSLVEVLLQDSEVRSQLSDDHLRRFPDLMKMARKIQRKACSLQDLHK